MMTANDKKVVYNGLVAKISAFAEAGRNERYNLKANDGLAFSSFVYVAKEAEEAGAVESGLAEFLLIMRIGGMRMVESNGKLLMRPPLKYGDGNFRDAAEYGHFTEILQPYKAKIVELLSIAHAMVYEQDDASAA